MPVTDPFIYLLLVALAAPVLWAVWWTFDAVFTGTRVAAGVAPSPQSAKLRAFEYPRPVDLTLPRRPGTIAIYSATDQTELDGCRGANASGKCPRASADGTVACAGLLLSLPAPIRGSAEWQIPLAYKVCPVASYDIYRQRSAVAAVTSS